MQLSLIRYASLSLVLLLGVAARAESGLEFEPGSCSGQAMSLAKAISYFQPGESFAKFIEYTVVARRRKCNAATGCGAWTAENLSDPTAKGRLNFYVAGDSKVRLSSNGYACGIVGDPMACWNGLPGFGGGDAMKYVGVLNENCLQLIAQRQGTPDSQASHYEYEWAILEKF